MNFNIISSKFNLSIIIPLLIACTVPGLILGPFLPDLIVSVSALIFLYFVLSKRKFYFFKKKPTIIFFVFCVYCIFVSIFVSENIYLSLESSLFYFRIGVFACVIWYLIEKDKKILNFFYYSLVICFLSLIVDGYIQYFSGENILGLPKWENKRISSFFGNELIMGSYLSRLFPLLFALFLVKDKKSFENYFMGLFFILLDILIYISGERTAFFFLNLSTIFIIVLIKKYQKFRLITFIIAIFFIAILTNTNDKINTRMIITPATNLGLLSSDKEKVIFTPQHDSLIKTAFNLFEDKPIFGHGPKMFRIKCKDDKYATGVKPCSTHPHNFYIQLLAETGIIGFIFLLSAFLYVIFCVYKQLKSIFFKKRRYLSDYQVCLLAGILITVWPFSPNGNIFNNWLAICYSLPVGFYLHSIFGKNKNKILKR